MLNSNSFTSDKKCGVYGIDLGTTNSCISVVGNSDVPEIIRLDNGKVTMPSCVKWDSNKDEFIVGDEAYNERYKDNVCYSVKTLMGSGKTVVLTHAGKSREMTPSEVSAEILKALVKKASTVYKDIHEVVITVPAEFNNKQVEDTLEAGRLAGLKVLHILREPTSASLVYKQDSEPGTVLVYDLGGGTFDVSLVKIDKAVDGESDLLDMLEISTSTSKDSVSVIATRGDSHLGGDDLDIMLYDIIAKKLKSKGVDISKISRQDREELILRLEGHKKVPDFTTINMNISLTLTDGSKVKTMIPLSIDDFKKATYKLFNKTRPYINDLLEGKANIKSIVLVGGSTKNIYLQDLISKSFPNTSVYKYLNPDEAVSLGAAVDAKREKYGSDTLEIFDVLSSSIGVLADNRIVRLIEKNQTVPCSINKMFATTVDNQSMINIRVYQGEGLYEDSNLYLGDLKVEGLKKGKAGEIGIIVGLTIDNNGVLRCSATIPTESGELTRNIELVNVLGKDKTDVGGLNDKSSSVKFRRWREFAQKCEDVESREVLYRLIDEAEADNSKVSKVIEFIRGLNE